MADIQRVEIPYEEDYETWEAFKSRENFRWLFNKLEVAHRQRLHCGPAGTAPEREGYYIHRPAYSIFGMGIGAKKFYYIPEEDSRNFVNHKTVPPGHFWCEWLEGPQWSIDYQLNKDNFWEVRSFWIGHHKSDENLTQFDRWEKQSPSTAPSPHLLPLRFPWNGVGSTYIERDLVHGFNVEMRQGKIIEVHLRYGNDPFDDLPVGTVITPIWDNEEIPKDAEFMANLHSDISEYEAHGYLSNVRKGFKVTRPSE